MQDRQQTLPGLRFASSGLRRLRCKDLFSLATREVLASITAAREIKPASRHCEEAKPTKQSSYRR
jgi:hypothetical protein